MNKSTKCPIYGVKILAGAISVRLMRSGRIEAYAPVILTAVVERARSAWRCFSLIGTCAGMAHLDQKPLAIRYGDERGL
jgi:hypothetical protein